LLPGYTTFRGVKGRIQGSDVKDIDGLAYNELKNYSKHKKLTVHVFKIQYARNIRDYYYYYYY
jgi:hypothetical protein